MVDEFIDLVMKDERYAHVAVRFAQEDPDRYAIRIGGEGRVHYLRALKATESQDEEELKLQLDRAIELEPENAEYSFLRGAFKFRKACADEESAGSASLDAARIDLEHTVDLNPFRSRYWLMLHELTVFQGDDRRALEAIGRAIEQSRQDAGLLERRAKFLFDRQSYIDSVKDCTRAIEVAPMSVNAHWLRACAYQKMGRPDEAMADTDKAIELAPDEVKFYRARARLWGARGNLERAQADLSHALELEPDQVDILRERAKLRLLNGDVELARKDIDRALELRPGDTELTRIRVMLESAKTD